MKKIEEKGGVYGIFNLTNGLIYVGSSYYVKARMTNHKWKLRKNIHNNIHLQNSWNKYGENNFAFKTLELCPENKLIEREQYWMNYYKSCQRGFGYNIEPAERHRLSDECKLKLSKALKGRPAWNKGKKNIFSPEALQKISEAAKGRPSWNSGKKGIFSDEARRKISEHHMGNKYSLGHKHSDETRQKMSRAKKGLPLGPCTEEHRRKISEARKGFKVSEETKRKISETIKRQMANQDHWNLFKK